MGSQGIRRGKRRHAPAPITPRFHGVEDEPWARYTGAGAGLRLVAAILRPRRGGTRVALPPLTGYLVGAGALVGLFLLGWGLIWFLSHLVK